MFLCRSFTTLISENIVFLFPEHVLVFRGINIFPVVFLLDIGPVVWHSDVSVN